MIYNNMYIYIFMVIGIACGLLNFLFYYVNSGKKSILYGVGIIILSLVFSALYIFEVLKLDSFNYNWLWLIVPLIIFSVIIMTLSWFGEDSESAGGDFGGVLAGFIGVVASFIGIYVLVFVNAQDNLRASSFVLISILFLISVLTCLLYYVEGLEDYAPLINGFGLGAITIVFIILHKSGVLELSLSGDVWYVWLFPGVIMLILSIVTTVVSAKRSENRGSLLSGVGSMISVVLSMVIIAFYFNLWVLSLVSLLYLLVLFIYSVSIGYNNYSGRKAEERRKEEERKAEERRKEKERAKEDHDTAWYVRDLQKELGSLRTKSKGEAEPENDDPDDPYDRLEVLKRRGEEEYSDSSSSSSRSDGDDSSSGLSPNLRSGFTSQGGFGSPTPDGGSKVSSHYGPSDVSSSSSFGTDERSREYPPYPLSFEVSSGVSNDTSTSVLPVEYEEVGHGKDSVSSQDEGRDSYPPYPPE